MNTRIRVDVQRDEHAPYALYVGPSIVDAMAELAHARDMIDRHRGNGGSGYVLMSAHDPDGDASVSLYWEEIGDADGTIGAAS